MRESWTDERLDDFRDDVNRRFDEVSKRFDKVEAELHRINDRLDAMQRLMAQGFIAMTTAIVAGFGGMAALIATQL
jgi:chromosome segregation ATPase